MNKTYLIFYVDDFDKTKMFYELLFNVKPIIDEPSMCEYELPNGTTLGIMPSSSLAKLFGNKFVEQKDSKALPNVELYFMMENAIEFHKRALQLGATEIKEFTEMDWGDKVAYSLNHDGHILAFAERIK